MSDHRYLTYEVRERARSDRTSEEEKGWRLGALDENKFIHKMGFRWKKTQDN
jgi:hypothetical protein